MGAEPPGAAAGHAPLVGIGIDIERVAPLAALPADEQRRLADRWLGPRERAWCLRQPDLPRALAAVLCCREALAKATGLGLARLADVDLGAEDASGLARTLALDADGARLRVQLAWTATAGYTLGTALAWRAET